MYALFFTSFTHICCGNYATGNVLLDELAFLANEKGAMPWRAFGTVFQGSLFALPAEPLTLSIDQFGDHRVAADGSNIICPVFFIEFGESLCGPRPIRRCLALRWRRDDDDRDNKGRGGTRPRAIALQARSR